MVLQKKTCSRCNEEKPLTAFYKDIRHVTKHCSYCKECDKQAQRLRRIELKQTRKVNTKIRRRKVRRVDVKVKHITEGLTWDYRSGRPVEVKADEIKA